MKILFGVPIKIHKEIADAEVEAFKNLGNNVETSFYGNSDQVTGLFGRFFLIIKNATNLKRKLIKQKSDLVYLNTAFDFKTLIRDSISIFFLKFFNKKIRIVLKTHGTIKSTVNSKSFLEKYVYKNTDLILVLSKEEQRSFEEIFPGQNKVFVTANPVDFANYTPDPYFKRKLNIGEDCTTLLFVGRFLEQKGILDLIQACKIVKEKSLCFKLICLGNGPLFDEVRLLSEKLNLKNEIIFIGHIPEENTKYYYSNCDITILPSYREGFPMAIFQSVAAGKAVITTKINACRDYFKEYENCLWVEKKNPLDLSEKILILSQNKTLRENISVNNLTLAQRFTAQNIASNLNAKFEKLLDKDLH
ncbi:MAG: glycosyltransferase family 4 protein [Ginsengibacter sp.]